MTQRAQWLISKIAIWCGIFYGIFFIVFWYGFGHFWYPIQPWFSLEQITEWMDANRSFYIFGVAITMIGASFHIPWTAYVGLKMAEVEGKFPLLAVIQIIGGTLTVAVLSFPLGMWLAVSYFPDTSPEIMRTINGMSWLCFDMTYALTTVQNYAFGICFLMDKRPQPLFPRWIAWWSILAGTLYLLITGMAFTHSGLFCWYGALAYWIPYSPWIVWFMVASGYMIKDVNRQMRSEHAGVKETEMAYAAQKE